MGDTRPTFEDAFASAEAPPASDPSTVETPAAEPADATTPPAETPATEVLASTPGEPPKDRWPTILENARKKAAEEVEQRYAWAKQLEWAKEQNPEDLQYGTQWVQSIRANSVGTWNQLTQALLNHPEMGPQIRSELARTLSGFRQPTEDPEPQPDLRSEQDGTLVYSAPQLRKWHEWNDRRHDAALQERLNPIEQRIKALDEQEEKARLDAAAGEWANTYLARARERWPGWKDHEPAIKQAMVEHPDWSAAEAYIEVVAPHLSGSARQDVMAELQTKAAASALNPTEAAAATPHRPKDFWEAFGVER